MSPEGPQPLTTRTLSASLIASTQPQAVDSTATTATEVKSGRSTRAAPFASLDAQEQDPRQPQSPPAVRPIPVRPVPTDEIEITPNPLSSKESKENQDPPVPYCFGKFRDEEECKTKVIALMEDPASSTIAYCISVVVLVFIVISTITIVVETLPDYDNDSSRLHFYIVECISILFSQLSTLSDFGLIPIKEPLYWHR